MTTCRYALIKVVIKRILQGFRPRVNTIVTKLGLTCLLEKLVT